MNRWLVPPTVIALSASLLIAQGEVKEAGATQDAAKKEYTALMAEFGKAMKAFGEARTKVIRSDEFRQAYGDRATRAAAMKMLSSVKAPNDDFVPRFMELASKHPNTSIGADALVWVVLNSRTKRKAAQGAIETLISKHLAAPQMAALAGNPATLTRTLKRDGAKKALTAIIDGNPNKDIVTEALFSRIEVLKGRGATEEDEKAAEKDLSQLQKIAPGAVPENGVRFANARLQIGAKAPDILGSDIDGVTFKLSDYRGKVVVLDFWGDW